MIRSLAITIAFFCTSLRAGAQNGARFSDFKPGMIDEQLQEQALKVANQNAVDLRCPERYYKAVILSLKWHLELDKSGFVTGRKIHMELLSERADGTCGMSDFTFRQKHYMDDIFNDKLMFVRNGNTYSVACE